MDQWSYQFASRGHCIMENEPNCQIENTDKIKFLSEQNGVSEQNELTPFWER